MRTDPSPTTVRATRPIARTSLLIAVLTALVVAVSLTVAGVVTADRGEAASAPVTVKKVSTKKAKKIAKKYAKKYARREVGRRMSADSVLLSIGQSRTVLSKGPFQVIATCSDDAGETRVDLRLVSDEPGSVYNGGPSGVFGPAGVNWSWVKSSGDPMVWGYNLNLLAPDPGRTHAHGHATAGVHVMGADCMAMAFLIID